MKRGWLILGLAAVFVAALVGLAFAFGTPQAPPSPAVVSPPSSAEAGDGVAPPSSSGAPGGAQAGDDGAPFGGEIVEGEVPEPDPQSPFAFQIPGCNCHSDDPVVVEEHANYRLNQCRGCHAGSP
ncbi:MAG: hypothetical protein ACNA76_04550 [Anaerosomatales bacterium]|nr:hypothetical protein [Coriobacteriia bacterium]